MVESTDELDFRRYHYNIQPPTAGRRVGDLRPQDEKSNCNQLILGDIKVITSPNYPVDYPANTRCNYIVRRYAIDVCQVRLDFLNFDLEQSADCRADYFHIDHTNEKLCGRDWSLPERSELIINFSL